MNTMSHNPTSTMGNEDHSMAQFAAENCCYSGIDTQSQASFQTSSQYLFCPQLVFWQLDLFEEARKLEDY